MNAPAGIFRQYDVRGIAGSELTPELAHALGRAFCSITTQRAGHAPVILVGRDNRPSGGPLASALRDGIAAAGGRAVDIGEVPTPALYFAVADSAADAGIQVTGSHNPPEFNGFKMVLRGSAFFGDDIQQLRMTMESGVASSGQGTLGADHTVLERYARAIVEHNRPLARPVRVVVDCGNGVASHVAVELLSALGADVIPLYCESDGRFPNHHPDPTVLENLNDLQAEVRRTGAELGLAFDGDADRIGAVDERGEVVFGDQLLILFARDLVHRLGAGHKVIFDVKCSSVLSEEIRRAGLEPVIWKTGHSLIKTKMKETGAPLAGEMSGHIFFGGDWYGFDDALFAAARLIAMVARQGGPLSRLTADIPRTYATPELRIDCPDDAKFAIVEEAARYFGDRYEVLTLDGVRINYPDGWGLLRASNTQPVLVLRFEAVSEANRDRYRGEVEGWLRSRGVRV